MSPTNKEKNTVTFLIHFDLLPAGQLDKNFILFSLSIVRNEVERHLLYTPKFFLFCFILFLCVCVGFSLQSKKQLSSYMSSFYLFGCV
jgi:hypothetical protein